MPDLAEDELLVRIKACGIYGSALQQRDPLEALIELTGGPGPIGRFEVKGGLYGYGSQSWPSFRS